jgi:hypothetical protein
LPDRVRSALPQAYRRPVSGVGGVSRARHHPENFHPDPQLRRRVEPALLQRTATARSSQFQRTRFDFRPAPHATGLKGVLEQNLLLISAVLLFVGTIGWCLYLYDEFRSSVMHAQSPQSVYAKNSKIDVAFDKSDAIGGFSSYVRTDAPLTQVPPTRVISDNGESAASIVARDWSLFRGEQIASASGQPAKTAKGKAPTRVAAVEHPASQAAPVRQAPQTAAVHPAPQAEPVGPAPHAAPVAYAPAPEVVASLGPAPDSVVARLSPNVEARTELVDFETAPFPYNGMSAGTNRPFLKGGRHVNFRGRVFWESKTFSDDHVLLHIPAGFDPRRPAVMVVFFHGHGAILARDVRDRQKVPAQISAAGANAVLVAPQFAVDAADSSAGKFWEQDGFKHFLDEASQKLAALYGNPRGAAAFANMPVVIVAYSGGFGPLLSVLARGGVRSRIRGLVLLDALYGGFDQFADWIANNRSTFFVSSYTPYTARHNVELEHLLDERGVPYESQLRRDHLQGMVAFLPAGEVSHRDFVTHAWADNPIVDILDRMDDIDSNIATAGIAASKRN